MRKRSGRLRRLCAFVALVFCSAGARAAGYGVTFTATPPSAVTVGQVLALDVVIQNTGDNPWTRDDCAADTKFNLFYHWSLNGVSEGPNLEGQRTPVPKTMKKGDSAKVSMVIQAPDEAGDYVLTLDMVQEGVTWFSTVDKANLGGPFSVKVKDAPAVGSISGIVPWYPLATPTSLEKIFVLREGNCSIELDFGDGTKATLSPTEAGILHSYPKGKFPLKATGCGGTVTSQIEVADTACPFFLPLFKVCEKIFDCCDVNPGICAAIIELVNTGPPKIVSVDYVGGVAPGDWLVIDGKDFVFAGSGKGKLEFLLKNPTGGELLIPLEIGPSSGAWTKEFILARIPLDASGAMAQTGFFRATRADGKQSNLYPVVFSPAIDFQTLPPSAVSASCANEVSCNWCNDKIDGCEFSGAPTTSIEGWHQSIPILGFFGICALGGGSGTDHYTASLANGWKLAAVGVHQPYGSGQITGTPGFTLGASAISGDVSWHVDGCKTIDYTVELVIEGPRGVPFQ